MLPSRDSRVLAIVLSRTRHDFSDEEVELIEAARPHLIQAYRNTLEHSSLLRRLGRSARIPPRDLRAHGLTRREAEVLRHVAAGRSNADVATELALSARAVQKHVENVYRKLGVSSRSEAARIAWASFAE